MVEDIVLDKFPKEAGVYLFKANEEIIYIGSSKNIHKRMAKHRSCIRKCSEYGYKQDLYQYLQSNPFVVEFQITNDYRQLEQDLVEKCHPKYNSRRAYTGVAWNGNKVEYMKEYNEKYKEEKLEESKQYYESHKEQRKQYYESHKEQKLEQVKKYNHQLCYFNGETITLNALRHRLKRAGFDHPTEEAKKYLI